MPSKSPLDEILEINANARSIISKLSTGEATYSTGIKKKKKPSSAVEQENYVIYNSVVTATRNKTLSPAGGDDGVIYSSVVSNERCKQMNFWTKYLTREDTVIQVT
ncbi:hypothetical protein MHYP_G00237830 [Metynnis hypsauchen]